MQSGDFSFSAFYERRARRIIPPLAFMVILVTVILVCIDFSPTYFQNFLKSVRYLAGFSSNIFFYRNTNYFSDPGTTKPLLHTWSLGVEEQFYLLFPIFLFLIIKFFKNRVLLSVVLLFLVSFILNIYFIFRAPEATFYLLPTRAWELLAGSILAIWQLRNNCKISPSDISLINRHIIGVIGMVGIIAGVVLLGDVNLHYFPGVLALLPVFGTFFCIIAGSDSISGRILSLKPLVHIGKISYSLYLWHWPLIVIAKNYDIILSWQTMLIVVGMAYLLSLISCKYIENPIRKKLFLPNRRKLLFFTGAVLAILFTTGYIGEYLVSKDHMQKVMSMRGELFPDKPNEPGEYGGFLYGAKGGSPHILILGDSHATILLNLFDQLGIEHNATVLHIYNQGPVLSEKAQKEFEDSLTDEISVVFIVFRWTMYAVGGTDYDYNYNSQYIAQIGEFTGFPAVKYATEQILATVKKHNPNIKIWIQLPVPEHNFDPIERILSNQPARTEYEAYLKRQSDTIAWLKNLDVNLIDPGAALCDEKYCYSLMDGVSMYRDDDHLSRNGILKLKYLYEPLLGK